MIVHRFAGCCLLLSLFAGTGCGNMSNTMKGGLVGAGVGTGIGTAIGSMSGNPGAGAAIGAGAGTFIGGLIGNDIDQEEKRQNDQRIIQAEATAAAAQAQAQNPPLGITGVAQLAQQGFSDDVIINQIRATNSTFTLSTSDLQWLKENRVSDSVIAHMQTCRPTPIAPPRRVVVEQPPTVIVQEAPPVIYARPYRPVYVAPPPPIGFGFSYTRVR